MIYKKSYKMKTNKKIPFSEEEIEGGTHCPNWVAGNKVCTIIIIVAIMYFALQVVILW